MLDSQGPRQKFRAWLKFVESLVLPGSRIIRQLDRLHRVVEAINERQLQQANLGGSPELAPLIRDVLKRLSVWQVTDHAKIRVGSLNDGGYVMLDHFQGIEAVFSLGIDVDVTWDLAMAERGLSVYQYDFSVAGPPVQHPKFRFQPLKIGARSQPEIEVTGFADVVKATGLESDKLILKIDIEGAEWEVFDEMDEALLGRFDQIVGEFHHFNHLTSFNQRARLSRVFDKLNRTHRLIHVHANNFAELYAMPGFSFCGTYEFTFVRADRYSFVPSEEIFPGPLDAPNYGARPDIFIGKFKY